MSPQVRQRLPDRLRGQLLGGAPHIVLDIHRRIHEQKNADAFLLLLLQIVVHGVIKYYNTRLMNVLTAVTLRHMCKQVSPKVFKRDQH